MGSKAFLLLLPKRLSSKQDKWSCSYLVLLSSAEYQRRRDHLSHERDNPTPSAVFIGQSTWLCNKSPLFFLLNFYTQNNCFSLAPPILKLLAKQDTLKHSLRCQHQKHEIAGPQTLRQQQKSKNTQICRFFGKLGRHQESISVLKPPIYPKN